MTARGIRTLRGSAAATFAVVVAALFHDAAGGGLPSALGVVLSLAFAVPVCIALAGRRIALWRQAACVGVSQVLLHVMFGLGSPASGTTLSTVGGQAHGSMLHGDMRVLVTGGHPVAMHHDGATMYLAHVGAALVTIAALRYGERAVYALATFTAMLVIAIVRIRVVPVLPAVRMPVQTRPLTLGSPTLVLGALRHRGPPVLGGV